MLAKEAVTQPLGCGAASGLWRSPVAVSQPYGGDGVASGILVFSVRFGLGSCNLLTVQKF